MSQTLSAWIFFVILVGVGVGLIDLALSDCAAGTKIIKYPIVRFLKIALLWWLILFFKIIFLVK